MGKIPSTARTKTDTTINVQQQKAHGDAHKANCNNLSDGFLIFTTRFFSRAVSNFQTWLLY